MSRVSRWPVSSSKPAGDIQSLIDGDRWATTGAQRKALVPEIVRATIFPVNGWKDWWIELLGVSRSEEPILRRNYLSPRQAYMTLRYWAYYKRLKVEWVVEYITRTRDQLGTDGLEVVIFSVDDKGKVKQIKGWA